MIITSIAIREIEERPGCHEWIEAGFAKDVRTWEWILNMAGWKRGVNYVTYARLRYNVEYADSDKIMVCDHKVLYVLNEVLHLN